MTTSFSPDDIVRRVVSVRRDLHQHPELSGQEHRTADVVASRLKEIGVDRVLTPVAATGVAGWIVGDRPGPCVLLRADMDALPITEADRGQPYRSTTEGVHHGCGHDGHTAILLGVAEELQARRAEVRGTVVLLFQPAEERGGGARRMLAERPWPGDQTPQASLGLHITTMLPVGTVDVRPGPVTASAQSVDVHFGSPGGHAALPELTPDPVVCAAAFIVSAQTVVSRNLSPRSNTVLGLSRIRAGTTRSAIPTTVTIEGTVRSYDDDDVVLVRRRVEAIAGGIAAAHGCDFEVDFKDDMYPASVNNETVTGLVRAAARRQLGDDCVTSDLVIAGADDMAEILADFPGCYFFLGGANQERGLTAPMHSPDFDFDEAAMPVGVALLVESVLALQEHLGPLTAKSARETEPAISHDDKGK